MGSYNKVTLLGNLGADPDIRSLNSGDRVASFRMATTESWKDKSTGLKQERTDWHTVVVFNEGLVGVIEQYLRKGSTVLVEGKLQTRKWQDREGNDRYSTEVVLQKFGGTLTLVGGKRDSDSGDRYASHQTYQGGGDRREETSYADDRGRPGGGGGGDFSADLDDEIPF